MERYYPDTPFERYADDAICHCRSEEQAAALRNVLEKRFAECGLTLQPSSRTGENPPYGMLGGIKETSASSEARSAP